MKQRKNLCSKALALLQQIGYGDRGERARKNSPSKTGHENFLYSASSTIPLKTIRFASGVNCCKKNELRLKLNTFQKIGGIPMFNFGLKSQTFLIFASNFSENFGSKLKSFSLILTEF